MTNKKVIQESAAGGSVSAGAVAVRTDNRGREDYPTKKRDVGLLKFLQRNNRKIANGLNMKEIKTPFSISLKENVSLDQIYSKLSGIQNQSRMHEDNTQTYGVEDDEGNLMKLTVRGDQQEEFETALAQELAEIEEYKMTGRSGHGGNVSMAEVLYNLKQNFDIVNVEFPEIPKDKIYNADKVSEPDEMDATLSPKPEQSPEDDLAGEEGFGVFKDDAGGEDLENVDFGEEDSENKDLEDGKDVGMEFGDEDEEESMLKKIIGMLSSEAEARRAQYEAEAEKSRALQAKYSMKAAQEEMKNHEELARMEQEMKQQKEKEKEAKKLADLAKFKMRGSVSESVVKGFGEFMTNILEGEVDAASLRRQRREISSIQDPQERALKQRELNAQIRMAQNKKREEQNDEPDENKSIISNRRGQEGPNATGSPNRRSGGMLP